MQLHLIWEGPWLWNRNFSLSMHLLTYGDAGTSTVEMMYGSRWSLLPKALFWCSFWILPSNEADYELHHERCCRVEKDSQWGSSQSDDPISKECFYWGSIQEMQIHRYFWELTASLWKPCTQAQIWALWSKFLVLLEMKLCSQSHLYLLGASYLVHLWYCVHIRSLCKQATISIKSW